MVGPLLRAGAWHAVEGLSAVAVVVGTRTGEPGPVAGAVVVAATMAPALVPWLPEWLRTSPLADSRSQPSNALWSVALVVCAGLIAGSITDRRSLRLLRRRP